MAIFTVDKFRAKDISARAKYFEKGEELEAGPQYTSGEEDYFLNSRDTILSEIVGTGSVALGLGGEPRSGDYELLFNGFNPRTGESFVSDVRRGQLDKDPKANAGFSTSFNVDKSLSLLYASAPKEVQQHFERAMMEAARRSIEQAEKRGIIGTRALKDSAPTDLGEVLRNINLGENGKSLEDVPGGIVSLNYLHFTNRAQEPHLHVHCEIPNLVLGEDGKWRTINARELYARQTEMAAMFDGYLYQAISRDCPDIARLMAVDFDRSGLIAPCVSQDLMRQFSSRREEIKETMREEGLSGADAARGVAKRTRNEKELLDPEELRERWRAEIGDIHHEPGDLTPATKLMVEQLLFRSGSVFKARDLDRAAAQLAICHGGPEDMPAIKSEICRQLGVITLPAQEGQKDTLYTSEAFRQLEVDLLRYAQKAKAPQERFALTDAALTAAVAQVEREKGFALRDEQKAAVVHAVSGTQLAVIEGAAGTGKSQTLAALRVGYEAAGHRVLGLAPSGAAAAELEKSSGIESRTIHALLLRLENDNPEKREVLSATDVLVVDEAGMVDTRTMHKLLGFAEQAGAKVVLTGDSKQLESVGSASTFQMLGEQLGAARLEQIARQRNADDRAISQAWFAGGDAYGRMEARGLLRAEGEGTPTAIKMLLRDAADTQAAGTDWREILLLADRNGQVNELNRRVRDHRKELGELDGDAEQRITVTGERGYSRELNVAPGDRLMLRRNALLGETPVYNGDRATLLSIDRVQTGEDKGGEPIFDHQLTVQLDRSGERLTWNLGDYDRLDHAYAMTVHKSQGLTVDHAFYLASEMSDRRSAYVAFTRSREACPFYLDSATADVFDENTSEFSAKLTALDADPETKLRMLAEAPYPASARVIEQAQPTTKALLERSGDRFEYPDEPAAPAKAAPEIIVITQGKDDAVLAKVSGYAVTELIDQPNDTRRRPGKPYAAPADAQRIALRADYLPPVPDLQPQAHQAKDVTHEKGQINLGSQPDRGASDAVERSAESRRMAKQFDKAAAERETQAMRREVNLIEFAERELGYAVDSKKSAAKYPKALIDHGEAAVMINGSDQIDVFLGPRDGNWGWYARKAGQQARASGDASVGGDIFKLYQRAKGGSFVQAKDCVRDFAKGRLSSNGLTEAEQKQLDQQREAERQEKAETEARRIEAGTNRAKLEISKSMNRRDTYLGPVRGISPEVLAETSWRTNKHGSAVFPHIGADLKVCGYEYRGHDLVDENGEPKKNRGFSSATHKGIYVANPLRPSAPRPTPTEICLTEAGVDTLSAYQMATPEERQRTFYVGVTGEPGEGMVPALKAFAEQHGIQRFSLAFDHDAGGDNLTRKIDLKLRQAMPDAVIEDARERMGLLPGEDHNTALLRRQRELAAESTLQRRPAEQEQAAQAAPAQTASERPAPAPAPAAESSSVEAEPEPAKPSWTPAPVPQQQPQAEQEQESDYDRDPGMEM